MVVFTTPLQHHQHEPAVRGGGGVEHVVSENGVVRINGLVVTVVLSTPLQLIGISL